MKKIPADKKRIENILITDIAEGGKGVGKSDELVLFVEKSVPGDVVNVELFKKKKNFAEAKRQPVTIRRTA